MSSYIKVAGDLGDITRRSKSADTNVAGLILAMFIPVAAGAALATVQSDAMKHPSITSRIVCGATIGGAVAGAGTTGLSGNKSPELALLSMVLGATAGIFGAYNLAPIPKPKAAA